MGVSVNKAIVRDAFLGVQLSVKVTDKWVKPLYQNRLGFMGSMKLASSMVLVALAFMVDVLANAALCLPKLCWNFTLGYASFRKNKPINGASEVTTSAAFVQQPSSKPLPQSEPSPEASTQPLASVSAPAALPQPGPALPTMQSDPSSHPQRKSPQVEDRVSCADIRSPIDAFIDWYQSQDPNRNVAAVTKIQAMARAFDPRRKYQAYSLPSRVQRKISTTVKAMVDKQLHDKPFWPGDNMEEKKASSVTLKELSKIVTWYFSRGKGMKQVYERLQSRYRELIKLEGYIKSIYQAVKKATSSNVNAVKREILDKTYRLYPKPNHFSKQKRYRGIYGKHRDPQIALLSKIKAMQDSPLKTYLHAVYRGVLQREEVADKIKCVQSATDAYFKALGEGGQTDSVDFLERSCFCEPSVLGAELSEGLSQLEQNVAYAVAGDDRYIQGYKDKSLSQYITWVLKAMVSTVKARVRDWSDTEIQENTGALENFLNYHEAALKITPVMRSMALTKKYAKEVIDALPDNEKKAFYQTRYSSHPFR